MINTSRTKATEKNGWELLRSIRKYQAAGCMIDQSELSIPKSPVSNEIVSLKDLAALPILHICLAASRAVINSKLHLTSSTEIH